MTRLIIFLFLVSCGSEGTPQITKGKGTDPSFIPYVVEFEESVAQIQYQIPITFRTIDDLAAGYCQMYDVVVRGAFVSTRETQREIFINRNVWDRLNHTERRLLIFHELGHCALGLDHNEDTFSVARAESGHRREEDFDQTFIPDPLVYVVARMPGFEVIFPGWSIEVEEIPYSFMFPSIFRIQGDSSDLTPHYYAVLRGDESPLGISPGQELVHKRPIENMLPEYAGRYKDAKYQQNTIYQYDSLDIAKIEGTDYEIGARVEFWCQGPKDLKID